MISTKNLIVGAYAYSGFQLGAYWLLLNSNGNESWQPLFKTVWWTVLLPINLPTFALCRMAWGSLNIFKAEPVMGIFPDVVFASLLSVTTAVAALLWLRKRRIK